MPRRGMTLIELVLGLALLGILAGIATPRLLAWHDRIAVEATGATTRALLDEARATAIMLARPVELHMVSGVFTITTSLDTTMLVLRERAIDPMMSVTGLTRPLGFGAHGLAIGAANRTIRIEQGRIARDIVISRLGRIR